MSDDQKSFLPLRGNYRNLIAFQNLKNGGIREQMTRGRINYRKNNPMI